MADISHALKALADGEAILVVDDRDRENEADLVMAACFVTREHLALFLRHGSGIVCAPMSDARADRLGLPSMVAQNTDSHQTAFTISTDHVSTGTGISADDRAATIRALADPATQSTDLRRPGHVFPLRARPGGVLQRRGHTEAAIDLVQLAGLPDVAVITEVIADDGVPMTGAPLDRFAEEHGLVVVSVDDVARHRRAHVKVTRTGQATIPLRGHTFVASTYRSELDDAEHLSLTFGDIAEASTSPDGVLTRMHSECLTGDLFGSSRCDCGAQLNHAIDQIVEAGAGVIVYLRGHEGRGIGLGDKLRAYSLQDQGLDTVDANIRLGLPIDAREYGAGAAILADLGARRVALITNNPQKCSALEDYGLELVRRVQAGVFVTPENREYLRTKRERLGHDLPMTGDDLLGVDVDQPVLVRDRLVACLQNDGRFWG